jgi:hypothetical protein
MRIEATPALEFPEGGLEETSLLEKVSLRRLSAKLDQSHMGRSVS